MSETIQALEARLLRALADTAARLTSGPFALGLSGGRDSILLAEALHRIGQPFTAWHFNHRWRGADSDADAVWVRTWCRQHAIPCRIGRAPAHLPATEGAARAARWAFFQRMAARHHTTTLWLAHHADDRAETLLLQLTRGASPGALSGPRLNRQHGTLQVVRPLISFRRSELTRLARHWRLSWLDDPSNADPRHRRNALRLRLLPALSRWAGRDIVPLLARTAEIIEAEEDYWATLLPTAWPATLSVRDLRARHPAWQRRALKAWLLSRGVTDADFTQIEAIRGLLLSDRPARVNLSRGRHCRRRAGRLWVE